MRGVLEQAIFGDHDDSIVLRVSTWVNSNVLYRGEY